MRPLADIEVLDFSSLLPGPLATLILAEAGARVTKVERPGGGDEMRGYAPRFGAAGVNFALLNRGKASLEIDLKAPDAVERLRPRLERADVLVEQFRPGVMERLGLGYDAVAAMNRGIVYCSLTGYGQSGPRAGVAAHDLNYVADTGLLGLVGGGEAPVLPPALVADIGGGSYPAVINILLALAERARSGRGAHLDVAMTDNVFPFLYWAVGNGLAEGRWPARGAELLTGGSPRYHLYRTADGRYVAAAPLEQRFWVAFCDLIGLEGALRDDGPDPGATATAVAERIAARPAAHWAERFAGADVCCSIVRTVEEAVEDEHFRARGVFARRVSDGDGATMPALPVPVVDAFRGEDAALGFPDLGEDG